MSDSRDELTRLAGEVADGTPVDWDKERRDPSGDATRDLEAIAAIAAAHRTLAPASAGDLATGAGSSETVAGHLGHSRPHAAPIGTWGTLQLLEKVGEGGFGEVFRAFDPALHHEVALKLLLEDTSAFAGQRYFEEARRLARVRSPHVVVVHGVDRRDGRVGLWTELIQGETLEHLMARHGPYGAGETMAIGMDLCRALASIHHVGLVHGDLKASNVMRERAGRIVLMDFGTAREAVRIGSETDPVAGTPLSMAPEHLLGERADHRADLYALGALLYRLLTGRHPIEAETLATLTYKAAAGEVTPLRDVRPDLPPELIQVIERALARRPEQRFESAGAMERALSRAAGTSTRDVARRSWLPSARWRAAAVVLVLALGAGAALLARWGRSPSLVPTRVAVAMFDNRTGNPSLDPVGRIAADWIASGLASTGLVDLVPSTIVLRSSRQALRLSRAGVTFDAFRFLAEDTGAGLIVTGAYFSGGRGLQFQANIIDARHERVLVSIGPEDALPSDPMGAIEKLRQRVVGALAVHVNPRLAPWGRQTTPPPSHVAYERYVDGLDDFVREDWAGAAASFLAAWATDTAYVAPLLQAGFCYFNAGSYARSESLAQVVRDRSAALSPFDRVTLDWLFSALRGDLEAGHRLAREGADLAPGSLWAYQSGLQAVLLNRPDEAVRILDRLHPDRGMLRGWVPYWETLTAALHARGDHRRELVAARRARARHPGARAAVALELRALAALGRDEELLRTLDEGLSIAPESGWQDGRLTTVAARELLAHGGERAALPVMARNVAWYRRRVAAEDSSASARAGLAGALHLAGQWQESRALFDVLATEQPDNVHLLGYAGVLAARLGDHAAARRAEQRLAGFDRPYVRGMNLHWQADIAAQLGEGERAVELLRSAFQRGRSLTLSLHDDPDLAPLRDDPSFRELMKPRR